MIPNTNPSVHKKLIKCFKSTPPSKIEKMLNLTNYNYKKIIKKIIITINKSLIITINYHQSLIIKNVIMKNYQDKTISIITKIQLSTNVNYQHKKTIKIINSKQNMNK
jgi:hypothetical protein